MALFNSKKEKKTSVKAKEKAPLTTVAQVKTGANSFEVLLRPRITEKATDEQQKNVYTFEIHPKAGKRNVALAFQKIYKVTPVKVNIVKNPAKKVSLRGRYGMSQGVKKAYIFLKEGDKIDLV